MKVADVMSSQVDFVSVDTPVKEVSRLIFGRGINGVPVCKDKKLVGFITEHDILSKFFPTMEEYMQDPVYSSDFEAMEEKVSEIFSLTADKIMSGKPVTVFADTPLLHAQSLIMLNKVGRLPVIDGKGYLIGIISKGDIFRAVVGQKLPFEADEQFHDWLARRFDRIVDQQERLSKEIPDLVQLFKKEKVSSIVDVGCGTGVHVIALAEKGFEVTGIDRSTRMIEVAKEKLRDLPEKVRGNIKFINHEYEDLDKLLPEKFDSAIFMGSGLAHNPDPERVLLEINKILKKKAVLACQIANYHKVINVNKRLYDFNIRKSAFPAEREQAFVRFFDPEEAGYLKLIIGIFARGPKRWTFKGMHEVAITPLDRGKMTALLKKLSFTDISFYGEEQGFYYDYLFRKPFKLVESDVLMVMAKRH